MQCYSILKIFLTVHCPLTILIYLCSGYSIGLMLTSAIGGFVADSFRLLYLYIFKNITSLIRVGPSVTSSLYRIVLYQYRKHSNLIIFSQRSVCPFCARPFIFRHFGINSNIIKFPYYHIFEINS